MRLSVLSRDHTDATDHHRAVRAARRDHELAGTRAGQDLQRVAAYAGNGGEGMATSATDEPDDLSFLTEVDLDTLDPEALMEIAARLERVPMTEKNLAAAKRLLPFLEAAAEDAHKRVFYWNRRHFLGRTIRAR
jgi:hypothetical protein